MGPAQVFCGIVALTIAATAPHGGQAFYFPDQVQAKAESKSEAYSDGGGGSSARASASGNAVRLPRYPQYYGPDSGEYDYPGGYGHNNYNQQSYGGIYPIQGPHNRYPPPLPAFGGGPVGGAYDRPYNPYYGSPALSGHYPYHQSSGSTNSLANAQSNGGSSLANSVSGSQSVGPHGESGAAAAAATAGTGFVNGVPVSSAAAASSASSASLHGGSSVSSSANANGAGSPHYPSRPYYPGFGNGPYDNYYGQSQYQPWLRSRSGGFSGDDDNGSDESAEIVESSSADGKSIRITVGSV